MGRKYDMVIYIQSLMLYIDKHDNDKNK